MPVHVCTHTHTDRHWVVGVYVSPSLWRSPFYPYRLWMFSSDEIRDVARLTQLFKLSLTFLLFVKEGVPQDADTSFSTFNLKDDKLDVYKNIYMCVYVYILAHICLTAVLTFQYFFWWCTLQIKWIVANSKILRRLIFFLARKKEIVETVGQVSSCKMQFYSSKNMDFCPLSILGMD